MKDRWTEDFTKRPSADAVVSDAMRKQGKALLREFAAAVRRAEEKQGGVIAVEASVDPAQFSRAINGQGYHVALEWLATVLRHDRSRKLAQHIAAISGGVWVPLPELTTEEELAAIREELERRELDNVRDAAVKRALERKARSG